MISSSFPCSVSLLSCLDTDEVINLFFFHRLCREGLATGILLATSGSSSVVAAGGGGGGSSTSLAGDLEGNVTTKGAGTVVVGDLEETEVGHAASGVIASALGSSRDVNLELSVGTNVGGTLLEANGVHNGVDGTLDDVALAVADHVGGGGGLDALGVGTGSGGVDDGEEVAVGVVGSAVRGDSAPSTGNGAAVGRDLGQGVAHQLHALTNVGNLELAAGGGLAEAVGHGPVAVAAEDGGIRLGVVVGAEAGDGVTLDAESSTGTTSVTSDGLDLAVGADKAGSGGKSEEDRLRIHVENG